MKLTKYIPSEFQGYPTAPQMNHSHHQYKPFYYQDSNVMNNSEETTIIDLDSNDGVQAVEEQQPESITPQPRGRLRIINQPDGPMTENIHDLKSTSAVGHVQTNLETHPSPGGNGNNFLWMPNTNNLLVASLDQNPHPQQQQQSTFDVENSLWYNQFNYNEEPAPPGPSWNTPAATCSTSTPSTMPWPPINEAVATAQTSTSVSGVTNSHDQEYDDDRDPDVIMGSSSNSLDKSAMSKANKDPRDNDEVKLRPPPPLLAKGSPVGKVMLKACSTTTGSTGGGSGSCSTSNGNSIAKRPELEVRKDLTLPTAPTGN